MVRIEDECTHCATDNYSCLGDRCPNMNVARYYCDNCKCEVDKLYLYNGEQLCKDCVLESLEVVGEWI